MRNLSGSRLTGTLPFESAKRQVKHCMDYTLLLIAAPRAEGISFAKGPSSEMPRMESRYADC